MKAAFEAISFQILLQMRLRNAAFVSRTLKNPTSASFAAHSCQESLCTDDGWICFLQKTTMMDTRNVIAAGCTFQMYNHLKNKGPRYCHSCQATGAALHDAKVGSKDVIKNMHTAVEMEPRRAE